MGAWVETEPGGKSGGQFDTSICTMRREPGRLPTVGVMAREVSIHTGLISWGNWAAQVVPAGITRSTVPSKHTCRLEAWALTTFFAPPVWLSIPSRFCLLVTRTHLNSRASAPPLLGMSPAL